MALAAPALVRASSIMPVRDPKLVRGILLNRKKLLVDEEGHEWISRPAFAPLALGHEAKNHEVVWLREDHTLVREYGQVANNIQDYVQQAIRLSKEDSIARHPVRRLIRRTNIDAVSAIQASLRDPLLRIAA